jgi:Na+/melibiose symporter-like transporter
MNNPSATPSTPRGPQDPPINRAKNPVAAHPITSAAIFVLVAASILCTLIVPIYAHITPKIGDWPFFYFYLLAYMPVVALALWLATLLQRRLATPTNGSGVSGSDAEVAR